MKEKIKELIRYHELKKWYEKYERVLIPGTLVLGVIFDFITFASIEIHSSLLLLGVYVVIVGFMILFVHAYDAGRVPTHYSMFRYLRLSVPLIIQFLFGALLSGSFVFYFFSGTLLVSWPFIALLVILMVSNEVFRHYYLRASVQICVYFFIVFSVITIALPFLLHTLQPWVFLLGGGMSLLLITFYTSLLGKISVEIKKKQWFLATGILIIFSSLNVLYFLNIIPPIPLSIRDAVVAHSIDKGVGTYILQVEQPSLWKRIFSDEIIHLDLTGRVYVYTAIFAPSDLHTKIVHHWQYFDETKNAWVTRDRITFPITGGRKEGYRGFSFRTNSTPGRWRVDVETERGQVLGRKKFEVLRTSADAPLKTIIK